MSLSFRWLNRHVFATSAAEFSRSATARDSEFSTSKTERGTFWLNERHCGDGPAEWDASPEPQRGVHSPPAPSRKRQRRVRGRVIIQFAANDPVQLADAAELVQPWVDGIDLNCGAPTSRHDFTEHSAHAHISCRLSAKVGLPGGHRMCFAAKAGARSRPRSDNQGTARLELPCERQDSCR